MYSQRSRGLPGITSSAVPFENKVLLDAVRLISGNLVKRAGISSRDTAYANLLSDIWGQSQYATIEILAAKRRNAKRKAARKPHEPLKQKQVQIPQQLSTCDPADAEDIADDLRRRKVQLVNKARDKLVTLLKSVKEDSLATNEKRLTCVLVQRETGQDLDALRRLWGIPQVVIEASGVDQFLKCNWNLQTVCAFYDRYIYRTEPDVRIFNVLHWGENRAKAQVMTKYNVNRMSVSRETIAVVVRLLLTKRRSPFFEKNMDVVVETVLYAINPDRFVERIRAACLRKAAFHRGLQGYEHSRSFTGALENLQLGKLNRMLKDIRAVKGLDEEFNKDEQSCRLLSLRAISRYCAERDTLTDRALSGVYNRYVRHKWSLHDSEACKERKMAQADFVRMYLALVGSGTDPGLKYWFSILDQDGDGWVGAKDVAHFYWERRKESEKRNGIMLADVSCLWIKLCAMIGVSPTGKGLDLSSLKELGREEREFMMCALLIRRVDDGNLINVAATVSSELESASCL